MMGSTALTDWLSIDSLAYSVLRVAMVWLAFHGSGYMIMKIRGIRRLFPAMPSIIPGMLFYLSVIILLSLTGLLTRQITFFFILPCSMASVYILYLRLRKRILHLRLRKLPALQIIPWIIAAFILITNIMMAGRPDLYQDDPHITYMVQPDRWLNDGRMSFLDETIFSGLPLTSEMMTVLPSSMAENRLDQLILAQMFQMSMLLALVICSFRILGTDRRYLPIAIISIAGCNILLIWAQLAKPDITALLFTTVALCLLFRMLFTRMNAAERDLSAFIVMGLAIATKLTAVLALIPFFAMLFVLEKRRKSSIRQLILEFILIAAVPAAFAIRTMIHTGSPFYSAIPMNFLLKPEWVMPEIDSYFITIQNRASDFFRSVSFFENIWHYFRTWGSTVFLLIMGFVFTLRSIERRSSVYVIAGIFAYSLAALLLFYPAWWGAKYGILIIPFAGLAGLQWLNRKKHGLLTASIIVPVLFILYSSPLSPTEHYSTGYRLSLIRSYFSGEWNYASYPAIDIASELPAQMWMNTNLPEGSTVLSLFDKKRYLCDHRYIVAWSHPVAARIFLDNTIEDEIEILNYLKIDFVIARLSDPVPYDGENRVEILSRIGLNDILAPMAEINGYIIYRYISDTGS